MRYTIAHRGAPLAIAEVSTPEQLGCVAVELLPAFDNLRTVVRSVWRDPQAVAPRAHGVSESPESLARELELLDASGAWLPTKRIGLWLTGPHTAVAFIDLDSSFAAVPARLYPQANKSSSSEEEF